VGDPLDRIEVTANRGDTDEPWRLVRLHKVLGYIAALSDDIGYDVLARIAAVRDHKGDLTVTWLTSPSDPEKAIVAKAWGSRVGDGGGNVEHASRGSQ
jgi:hypothetical protein